MSERFLVRFSLKYFLVDCCGGLPTGSMVPSMGAAVSYPAAFALAQRLKVLGYEDACVATITGKPALPNDIAAEPVDVQNEADVVWLGLRNKEGAKRAKGRSDVKS